MDTFLRSLVVLLCLAVLSGCTQGMSNRHTGTQSEPYPDQGYWQDKNRVNAMRRQWSEENEELARLRLQEFFR
jgi:hypothetical protein